LPNPNINSGWIGGGNGQETVSAGADHQQAERSRSLDSIQKKHLFYLDEALHFLYGNIEFRAPAEGRILGNIELVLFSAIDQGENIFLGKMTQELHTDL